MAQLAYLSDGIHIIKLWNTSNGFCIVIFSKHASTATGLEFVSNGQFIVSSSFDGTVPLCCALRHDGKQLAVSTVDAQILFLS
ncbi:unnamed protein product [Rotaria sp. Silwood1]|nr:unnamed protein product [Rotaria sp. Silwood1]